MVECSTSTKAIESKEKVKGCANLSDKQIEREPNNHQEVVVELEFEFKQEEVKVARLSGLGGEDLATSSQWESQLEQQEQAADIETLGRLSGARSLHSEVTGASESADRALGKWLASHEPNHEQQGSSGQSGANCSRTGCKDKQTHSAANQRSRDNSPSAGLKQHQTAGIPQITCEKKIYSILSVDNSTHLALDNTIGAEVKKEEEERNNYDDHRLSENQINHSATLATSNLTLPIVTDVNEPQSIDSSTIVHRTIEKTAPLSNRLGDIIHSEREPDTDDQRSRVESDEHWSRAPKTSYLKESITIEALQSIVLNIGGYDDLDLEWLSQHTNSSRNSRARSESVLTEFSDQQSVTALVTEPTESNYHETIIEGPTSSNSLTKGSSNKTSKLSQQEKTGPSYDDETSTYLNRFPTAKKFALQDTEESNQDLNQQLGVKHSGWKEYGVPTTSSIASEVPQHESKSSSDERETLGYQLRALSEKSHLDEETLFLQASNHLADVIQLPALSTELVTETLNYFVNCRQRLSQMTKTYDDTDAYILLLQEKEVDLELAARIGQDLLRQNNQLKDSIKSLEQELARRQEDVQQLKHDLASKSSLLDTFIQEEEQQNSVHDRNNSSSRATSARDETDFERDFPTLSSTTTGTGASLRKNNHNYISSTTIQAGRDQGEEHDGFYSLNQHQHSQPSSAQIDPFTSLPYNINSSSYIQVDTNLSGSNLNDSSQQHQTCDESSKREAKCGAILDSSAQRLVENVTFQLVESNKRLCELQDELIFKGEQSLVQQEKIFRLEQQIRDSEKRLDDIASENETLRKTILDSAESQRELSEELKVCKKNFSELLQVFIELQKESRINRNLQQQNSLIATYYSELDPINDFNNISFDAFAAGNSSQQSCVQPVHSNVSLGCNTTSSEIETKTCGKSLENEHRNSEFASDASAQFRKGNLNHSSLNSGPLIVEKKAKEEKGTQNSHLFSSFISSFISKSNNNLNSEINNQNDGGKCNLCYGQQCCSSSSPLLSSPPPAGAKNVPFCSRVTIANTCCQVASSPMVVSSSSNDPANETGRRMVTSTSLHEELRETMRKLGESSEQDEEEEVSDGRHFGAEEGDDEEDFHRELNSGRQTSSTSARLQPANRSPKHRARNQPAQHLGGCSCSSDQHSDSDGADSGLHTTTNASNSVTPHCFNTDTDIDDFLSNNSSSKSSALVAGKRSNESLVSAAAAASVHELGKVDQEEEESAGRGGWLSISSFMITTLLIICLSAGFNSSANTNLAQKLQQIRLDK